MQNPYAKYKEQSVMTMTQGDMLNLLYSEIINRLNKGLLALGEHDYEKCNTHFKKAQEILAHLSSTLDFEYPVSQGLLSLYDYFTHQILQANVKKEAGPVEEILPMVEELKDAFCQADKQARMERTG